VGAQQRSPLRGAAQGIEPIAPREQRQHAPPHVAAAYDQKSPHRPSF
jgi:hypothetical protein